MSHAPYEDYNTFEELYANNYKPLLAYISRRIEDTSEAEDLVQETFLRALQSTYTPMEGKHPLTWLCTIAARLIIDRHRHKTRKYALLYVRLGDDNESFTAPDSTDFEQTIAEQEIIKEVLARMPETYRRSILLHVAMGYDFKRLGEIENTSPNAIKSRYWRALAMFRTIYKEKAA